MKKGILLTCLFIISIAIYAQNTVFTGVVTNEKGEPAVGVSVMIKGTRTGAATDNNGVFRLSTNRFPIILVVSGVGYETTEITVTNATTVITIVLKYVVLTGTEVVITSVGISRQSKSVSYSLTGRAAGISITSEDKELKTWKRSGELDENSVRLSVGDKDYLPLKMVQVAVQIDGFRARLLFDYFFYSDKDKQLRGDFKLKLPAGASPYYFAFGGTEYINTDKATNPSPFIQYPLYNKIDLTKDTIRQLRNKNWNSVKEAMVVPKEKAAYAYNEVVRGRVDPALMEWAGADVFSCSIYPIQKNKLHRIVIGYDINLAEAGNSGLLNLILPYGNIPKKLDIDISTVNGLTHIIHPSIAGKLQVGDRHKYHLENFNQKSFAITTTTHTPVFLQQQGKENYFALSFAPPLASHLAGPGSDQAIFLLDVSLSSQPDKFNIWLKMIETLLDNNRSTIKKFAVLCFNTDVFWWKEEFVPNNQRTVGDFLEYADNLSLMGATDLGLAIKEAAQPAWLKNKTVGKTLFLLSDGDASWGEDNLYQLSKPIAATDKVFAFTTGLSGTDTRILDHLCRQTNGAVFTVLNEDEAVKVAQAIQYKPWRIENIRLKNGTDVLVAGRPYNIFPGQRLLLSGRGTVTATDEIIIDIRQGDITQQITLPAHTIIASNLTQRIYGQIAVAQLEDFSFATEPASIKYATYYQVAGQTCSWLMLESDALYNRYGLKTETSKAFIDSHLVNHIIRDVLAKEATTQSLGNGKEELKAWLNKLTKEGIIQLEPDTLFNSFMTRLPDTAFTVNVERVKSKLKFNKDWLRSTKDELNKSILDYDKLIRAVYQEKSMEGKADAFKVISSFAENNRADMTLLRDIAFQLSNWNLDGKAYELCKRLIAARPAEPQAYKQIASSLLKMNKTDLALVYYDIAFLTKWDGRFDGFDIINAIEYHKLLKAITQQQYPTSHMDFVNKRLATVSKFLSDEGIDAAEADLMVVITWNTDNTDVDLHVREPNNQECYYSHKTTSNGGLLTNDATEGFGPETYFIQKAPAGTYSIDIDYYSSSRVQTSARSKVFVTVYKNWGRSNEEILQKVIELKRSVPVKNRRNTDDEDEDKLLKDVFTVKF